MTKQGDKVRQFVLRKRSPMMVKTSTWFKSTPHEKIHSNGGRTLR
jgi:hypothetical protein